MSIQSSLKRTFFAISAAIVMSTFAVGAAVGGLVGMLVDEMLVSMPPSCMTR